MVLWTLTSVEVVSALQRLVRDKALAEEVAHQAEVRLTEIVRACHALHWAEGHPQGRTLHTLDNRLALAAQREGFSAPS
jgi:hypothetical protein